MVQGSKFGFGIIFMAITLAGLALSTSTCGQQAIAPPRAVQGVLDASSIPLLEQSVVLEGEWAFYPNQLLGPSANFDSLPVQYLKVPLLWNDAMVNGKPLGARGYGTYRLKVLVPAGISDEDLALDVPDAYSSLALYVNNQLFFQLGNPDTSAATTTPLFRPAAKRLHFSGSSFYLTLQVANFHHHKGGLSRSIVLGNNDFLKNKRESSRSYDLFLTGCLFMGGLFFLGLFIFGRQDRAILYFSLFCLIYAYRVIGTEEYGLHHIFPQISWFLSIRLEYATLFAAVSFLALFNYHLYPKEFNIWVLRIFLGFCSVGFLLSVAAPTYIFTAITPVFLVVMVFKLAYAMFVYILGFIHKRPGAVYSMLSSLLLFLLFIVIVIDFYSSWQADKLFLTLLYILFFFFQSLVLSYRFAFQLNSARDEALKAYQAKSDFLSTMSHEIRTPLNSVIGITNLLLRKKPEGEQKEFLDTLLFSANNLLYIINDILDFSKIEAGKMQLHFRPTVLGAIARRIISTSQVLAQEKGIELRLECPPALMQLSLMADPDRSTQVINNLIQNAIKFTAKGSVTLQMQLIAENAESVLVKIAVIDTGIGIPPEKQKLIFDEFTQADSSIHRGYGGTGLGLSICKQILTLQQVELELASTPNVGSTFWFQQQFARPTENDFAQIEHAVEWSDADAERLLRGKKVLIAEDNSINMMVAEKILTALAAQLIIIKAQNGREAVEQYRLAKPDLILMDVNMPEMDGLEATRKIRAEDALNALHTPIIALTAGILREDKERCIEAGMDTMIAKPFKVEDLRNTMIQLLTAQKDF